MCPRSFPVSFCEASSLSIQTATDIILDVVKAADPAVAQRAEAMLEAASARKSERAAATPAFEHQLLASSDQSSISVSTPDIAVPDKMMETYQRFEAMILQSFIGDMLPKDSEQLYGKGTAGEIWKGMMAEQLGAALAAGGGIGIAARMAGEGIIVAPPADDNLSNRAASMTNEIQTRILADIAGSDEAKDAATKSSQERHTA
jgi:flagellar protein FlgJ